MSLTAVCLFIAFSVAISVLIAFPLRLDVVRLTPLARRLSPSARTGQGLRGTFPTWALVAGGVLFVAGVGMVSSYSGGASKAPGSGSLLHDEAFAQLEHYTGSVGGEKPSPKDEGGKRIPDVNTMIERLAARLETTPGDIKGWQMLGWSYFHTSRYKEAAEAYAKALALDPSSDVIRVRYEEARAKASAAPSSPQAEGVGKGGNGPHTGKKTTPEALGKTEHEAIQAMVDGLAARLESAPRDVEGWTRLMRSRVVLGEREVAAKAFSKALEVFKDDAAASSKILAAATELGLKTE
jgi:cytochrome c-type biogenesis protein CcmH